MCNVFHPCGKLLTLSAAALLLLGSGGVVHALPPWYVDTEERAVDRCGNCNCAVNWGGGYPDLNAAARPTNFDWYAEADGWLLTRHEAGNLTFATLGPTQANTVIESDDLDLEMSGGFRVVVGRALGEYFRLEASYFGAHTWDDTAGFRDLSPNSQGANGNLFSPLTGFGSPATVGLDYNFFASVRQSSDLDNAEINLRYRGPLRCGPVEVSTLLGVRYMRVTEEFEYLTMSQVPPALGTINQSLTQTENDLVGGQIGALLNYYMSDSMQFDVEVKGALAQNNASQQTVYTNVDNVGATQSFANTASEGSTALIGEVSVTYVYRFTPNVSFRLGYQTIWVDGLALADENFRPDVPTLTLGPAQVDHNGTVTYHGPHMGLMVYW